MGYDPTGTWDWSLCGKVVFTVAVVALCMTGVGAVAAATATAIGVSVSAAVTTAVVTAGISTTFSAIDGAICAQQSGGEWYDGAMAGAIGGAAGSLVSKLCNPTVPSDTLLRFNTAGRAVSSLVYDITYDWFSGKLGPKTVITTGVDLVMDITIGSISNYYTGGFANSLLQAGANGAIDGIVDIFQTNAYFR